MASSALAARSCVSHAALAKPLNKDFTGLRPNAPFVKVESKVSTVFPVLVWDCGNHGKDGRQRSIANNEEAVRAQPDFQSMQSQSSSFE
jgi:hypothetical protein